jgi:hypothetical protein
MKEWQGHGKKRWYDAQNHQFVYEDGRRENLELRKSPPLVYPTRWQKFRDDWEVPLSAGLAIFLWFMSFVIASL